MNGYQKIILSVAIAVIVLMAVFPPWEETFTSTKDGSTVRLFAGYAGIFSPPQAKNTWTRVSISFRMLVPQWALVAVIAGSIIVRFKGNGQLYLNPPSPAS